MILDGDDDAATKAKAVSSAKSRVGKSIRLVGQEAVQIHGGIGVTDELGARINGVAVVEARAWTEESWALPGQPEDLRKAFQGWHPELQELLERVTP